MNISNSLLNGFRDYLTGGLCGYVFEAVFIKKAASFETTDAQRAGQWFEFMATGETLRGGKVPESVKTSKGAPAAITKYLTAQLNNFKLVYEDIEIIETGYTLEYLDDKGNKFKGILDVVADGPKIRDVKITGFLNNYKEVYGWADLTGSGTWNPEKKHLSQARFYIWLWYKNTGEIVPFYFDVFSSKNETDYKVFEIIFDEDSLHEYEHELYELIDRLHEEIESSFTPTPNFKNCKNCIIKEGCKFSKAQQINKERFVI